MLCLWLKMKMTIQIKGLHMIQCIAYSKHDTDMEKLFHCIRVCNTDTEYRKLVLSSTPNTVIGIQAIPVFLSLKIWEILGKIHLKIVILDPKFYPWYLMRINYIFIMPKMKYSTTDSCPKIGVFDDWFYDFVIRSDIRGIYK